MARIGPFLRLARKSDRHRAFAVRSGGEKLAELAFGLGGAYALLGQLRIMAVGPVAGRLAKGWLIVAFLCSVWLLTLLSVRPSMPAALISSYPLTRIQRLVFLLLSHLHNYRTMALLIASALVVGTMIRIPTPFWPMVEASGTLFLTVVLGLALTVLLSQMSGSGSSLLVDRRVPTTRRFPLEHKELGYFCRTLDPYAALIISVAAAYTELKASWMTPATASIPLLLIGMIQIAPVLNPFGLDSPLERNRYMLLPLSARRVLGGKHLALTSLWLGTASPLIGALLFRMSAVDGLKTVFLTGVILLGWLSIGLALMKTPAAQRVRLAFGSLSGEGMSISLMFQAVGLLIVGPLVPMVCFLELRGQVALAVASIQLLLMLSLYNHLLKKGKIRC